MTSAITRSFARYLALPVVSVGIIGGSAIGLAGVANASPTSTVNPEPCTDIVATPHTKGAAAATAVPGKR